MALKLQNKILIGLIITGLTGISHANANNNPSGVAQGQPQVTIPSLAVKKRLEAIEQIDVSAQKEPEPVNDAELQTILDEATALELQSLEVDNDDSGQ